MIEIGPNLAMLIASVSPMILGAIIIRTERRNSGSNNNIE